MIFNFETSKELSKCLLTNFELKAENLYVCRHSWKINLRLKGFHLDFPFTFPFHFSLSLLLFFISVIFIILRVILVILDT